MGELCEAFLLDVNRKKWHFESQLPWEPVHLIRISGSLTCFHWVDRWSLQCGLLYGGLRNEPFLQSVWARYI